MNGLVLFQFLTQFLHLIWSSLMGYLFYGYEKIGI